MRYYTHAYSNSNTARVGEEALDGILVSGWFLKFFILLMYYYYYYYEFMWEAEKTEADKEICQPLVHSPNALRARPGPGPKLGAGNSSWLYSMCDKGPNVRAITCCLLRGP